MLAVSLQLIEEMTVTFACGHGEASASNGKKMVKKIDTFIVPLAEGIQ